MNEGDAALLPERDDGLHLWLESRRQKAGVHPFFILNAGKSRISPPQTELDRLTEQKSTAGYQVWVASVCRFRVVRIRL